MAYTTIDDPSAYFQVHLYAGTGSTNARTLDGDTDLQPDMVWVKKKIINARVGLCRCC